jgi:site-specific DNA recombinase
MKKAVTYVRVSSKEQKQEGYSIPAQRRLLWDFASRNGFTVVKEFEDDETAKSSGRKNFGEMVEFIKANKDVNSILVEKTDRLYRNFKDYVIIDDLGVTVYLVKENEKIGKDASSHQKFIHGIKVLMAKNYVDNLGEEAKKGMLQKADSGTYPSGNVPLGYKAGEKNGKRTPVIDKKNRDLAFKIFEYYSTGLYSIEGLLSKLNSEGLINPDTFPKSSKLKTITKSTIQRIVRNPFYYGAFIWRGKYYAKGDHTPIVSKELWDKCQEVMSRFKNKEMASRYDTLKLAYKGLMLCGECGRTITGYKKTKPSGREYVYYRCTKFKTDCSQQQVSEKSVDEQIKKSLAIFQNLDNDAIAYVTAGLKLSLDFKGNTEDRIRKSFTFEKEKYHTRLRKLFDEKIDEKITEDFYKEKESEYVQAIKDLEGKIAKYTKADINFYKFGSKMLELAKNAPVLFEKALPEEKQEFLSFILSNSSLKDENLRLEYKKPFDKVHQRATCCDWRGRRDSNPRPSA